VRSMQEGRLLLRGMSDQVRWLLSCVLFYSCRLSPIPYSLSLSRPLTLQALETGGAQEVVCPIQVVKRKEESKKRITSFLSCGL